MTVEELIKRLQKIKDKKKRVFLGGLVYHNEEGDVDLDSDIEEIRENDHTIEIRWEHIL